MERERGTNFTIFFCFVCVSRDFFYHPLHQRSENSKNLSLFSEHYSHTTPI